MSPVAQPVSVVDPVSQIVREELMALLADPHQLLPAGNDVRVGMDILEIAQEHTDQEDDVVLYRLSSAVPAEASS